MAASGASAGSRATILEGRHPSIFRFDLRKEGFRWHGSVLVRVDVEIQVVI